MVAVLTLHLLLLFFLPHSSECARFLAVVTIESPTPFLEESLLDLFSVLNATGSAYASVHLRATRHLAAVERLRPRLESLVPLSLSLDLHHVRLRCEEVRRRCEAVQCRSVLVIDPVAHLRSLNSLSRLAALKLPAVAPLLRSQSGKTNVRPARAADHFSRGVFLVTNATASVLLSAKVLTAAEGTVEGLVKKLGAERKLFASGEVSFGNLMLRDNYRVDKVNADLWELMDNPREWEERYLNPAYYPALRAQRFEMPCRDVYWLPLFTRRFCSEMIAEMERFGLWSRGMNHDHGRNPNPDKRRLDRDFLYATVDITMWQIDYHFVYMLFLRRYLWPVQLLVYAGLEDIPYSPGTFVARYKPAEQVSLDPHFDTAQVSLNVALNTLGEDYEGGGTRFTRYNCSVKSKRPGWGLFHPNKPTHQHEGLELKNGIRYIMVSFIDGKGFSMLHGDPFSEEAMAKYGRRMCYGGTNYNFRDVRG